MHKVVLLFVALLLGACSQMPAHQRPALPVPEQWKDAAAESFRTNAAKTHWSQFFRDPRLHALIKTALDNNRDLRIAAGRVQEARAQFAMSRADLFPTLSLGPGTGTVMQPGVVWPYASISYELDFWGRVASMNESARFAYLATQEAQRAVQLSLVADVANAYFEILQADELLEITRATIALREQSLGLLDKSRELGASYDYEYQQANGLLESARAALAAQEHQRTTASNRLGFLMGHAQGSDWPAGLKLEDQGLDNELDPGLPSEVLLLRPDVMATEQRLKAANADIGVARAAYFPKISLTAGLGSLSDGLISLLDAKRSTLSPDLTLPALFDGGRTAAGVDVAQARKTIAVAEYERTIQQAFREVSDQISARNSLARQLRANMANLKAQEKRMQIAQARFNFGVIGYLEVIDAQRELLASQQAATTARRAQLDAAVQLYKALGGGERSNE
jgi:multidrug efflux system outer membrane protein